MPTLLQLTQKAPNFGVDHPKIFEDGLSVEHVILYDNIFKYSPITMVTHVILIYYLVTGFFLHVKASTGNNMNKGVFEDNSSSDIHCKSNSKSTHHIKRLM